MQDLISRQAAIEALERDEEYNADIPNRADGVRDAIITVSSLPSAQSERKKGKWIDYSDEGYVECPFCHSDTNCDGNKDELHYCFSCGADMRGEQDED